MGERPSTNGGMAFFGFRGFVLRGFLLRGVCLFSARFDEDDLQAFFGECERGCQSDGTASCDDGGGFCACHVV